MREYIIKYHKQDQSHWMDTRAHTVVRNYPKVGRNEPCPCGSEKKFKKCCVDYSKYLSGENNETT